MNCLYLFAIALVNKLFVLFCFCTSDDCFATYSVITLHAYLLLLSHACIILQTILDKQTSGCKRYVELYANAIT